MQEVTSPGGEDGTRRATLMAVLTMEPPVPAGVETAMRSRSASLFTLGPPQFLLLGFVLVLLGGLVGLLLALLLR